MIYVFSGNDTFLKIKDDEDPHEKISEAVKYFPRESRKYIKRGLKVVQADNYLSAREKAKSTPALEPNGQYNIFK